MNSLGWLGVSSLALAVACSSSGGGASSTVTGTIGGSSVATTNSVGLVGAVTVMSGATTDMAHEAVVFITNLPNACSVIQTNGNPPSATALTLVVGSAATVGAGTYTVGQAGAVAVINYTAQSATCVNTANDTAQSGSVTLSTVTASNLAGTFEATFPSGDKVSGSFDVPVCNASLQNLTMMTSATACGG